MLHLDQLAEEGERRIEGNHSGDDALRRAGQVVLQAEPEADEDEGADEAGDLGERDKVMSKW